MDQEPDTERSSSIGTHREVFGALSNGRWNLVADARFLIKEIVILINIRKQNN